MLPLARNSTPFLLTKDTANLMQLNGTAFVTQRNSSDELRLRKDERFMAVETFVIPKLRQTSPFGFDRLYRGLAPVVFLPKNPPSLSPNDTHRADP